MSKNLTPAIDLLIPSAKIIKDNLLVFFVLLIIPMLLSSLQGETTPLPAEPTWSDVVNGFQQIITPPVVVGSAMTLVLFPVLTFAQWKVSERKPKPVSLVSVFGGSKPYYWRLLGLFVCISLAVMAGLILFVLPGIWLLRRFILAPYFMLRGNLGIIESMRESARQTNPYAWSIYSIFGIMVLFALLGAFGAVGAVASVILNMLYNLALPLRFHEIIQAQKNAPQTS